VLPERLGETTLDDFPEGLWAIWTLGDVQGPSEGYLNINNDISHQLYENQINLILHDNFKFVPTKLRSHSPDEALEEPEDDRER
jgi:hypothetical protein